MTKCGRSEVRGERHYVDTDGKGYGWGKIKDGNGAIKVRNKEG